MATGHEPILYGFYFSDGVYSPTQMLYGADLHLQCDTNGGSTYQWKIGNKIVGTTKDLELSPGELVAYNDQIVYNPADPTGAYFPVTLTVDGKYIGTRNIILEHNLP
jgi:hypothetical protein